LCGSGDKEYKTEILGNIKICPACLQRSPAMLKRSQILQAELNSSCRKYKE